MIYNMRLFILFLLNFIATTAFPINITSNHLRKRNILDDKFVLTILKWAIIFVVVFLMSACCVCRRKRVKNNENGNDPVNS
ncbi:hypothetical protein C1646_78525 [Rhizophagus diaphanus]|nr:hypothetical protein C1646_78525 [Rhizophagus diaphanus] [Rhizophagus sp. MUCL 43196]